MRKAKGRSISPRRSKAAEGRSSGQAVLFGSRAVACESPEFISTERDDYFASQHWSPERISPSMVDSIVAKGHNKVPWFPNVIHEFVRRHLLHQQRTLRALKLCSVAEGDGAGCFGEVPGDVRGFAVVGEDGGEGGVGGDWAFEGAEVVEGGDPGVGLGVGVAGFGFEAAWAGIPHR